MGESMVQRLEEQSENPGSGFCLPQTLYMNKENRISKRRVAFFLSKRYLSLVFPKHEGTYRRQMGDESQHA